jgi:hypothetical protein
MIEMPANFIEFLERILQWILASVERPRNAFAPGYNYPSNVLPSLGLMLVCPVIIDYAAAYIR